ncbi:unnamed protein product [Microthlaspi erraticum]|uniref:Secreted protein n=1 Tax=Microthlaspi erraticum TaxID=1685480 RepID=A0A6D2HT10_9BRAS|nr:unnamed protein product [Microthlaspi erraticum]
MNLALFPPALSSSARLFWFLLLLGCASSPVTELTGFAEFSRTDLSPLFFNLPEQYAEPFSLRVSIFTAMPKPPPKPPDLQICLRPLVLYPSHSSQLSSFFISITLPDLSFLSTISLSFGQWKLLVLLLAGEGTSGSWIPGCVNLDILVRRCKILGLKHGFFGGSSLSKLFLSVRHRLAPLRDSISVPPASFPATYQKFKLIPLAYPRSSVHVTCFVFGASSRLCHRLAPPRAPLSVPPVSSPATYQKSKLPSLAYPPSSSVRVTCIVSCSGASSRIFITTPAPSLDTSLGVWLCEPSSVVTERTSSLWERSRIPFSSLEERILPPSSSLSSMELLPSSSFRGMLSNFFTDLFSYVAPSTESEEATVFVSTILRR